MTKRYLVLGGGGFIGSHVVDRLIEAGNSVTVLSRTTVDSGFQNDQAAYEMGDYSDVGPLAALLEDVDVVVHAASATNPTTGNTDPHGDAALNLLPTIQLLELMKENSRKKLIYLSSGGAVYGNSVEHEISESAPTQPISSYGIVKLAIEHYIQLYGSKFGVPYLILRTSNAYGPRQFRFGVQGIISTLLRNHLNQVTTEIWGDGSVVRDYIYISDLVEFIAAAEAAGLSGIYNVGSGVGHSVREVIDVVEKTVQDRLQLEYRAIRGFDVSRNVLAIEKAKKDANWTPLISLDEGVRQHYNWIKQQLG